MEHFRMEAETRHLNKIKGKPGTPPHKSSGDIYVIIGMLTGFFGGGLIGSFFGVFALTGGAIVGGVIGATIGNLIKRYLRNRKR